MLIQTNRDPFAAVSRLLGVRPQVQLHADDLTGASVFINWQGRKGSINGVGVANPYSAKAGWTGRGGAMLRAAHCWPSSGQYVTFHGEAGNYSAGTAFSWALATKIIDTAAQRNLLMLGAGASSNNWRGLYVSLLDQIGVLSNRSGATQGSTPSPAGFMAGQSLIIVSLDTDGELHIWQRSAENGTVELLDTTHAAMSGSLVVDKFTLGTLLINGASSSHAPNVTRYVACARGVAVDEVAAGKWFNLLETQLGCPLPATEPRASALITIPSVDYWLSGPLQQSTLPATDDQVTSVAGLGDGALTMVGRNYDLGGSATSEVDLSAITIPAGSSPFTILFNVRRTAGSLVSGTNYNIASASNLAITSLLHTGRLKCHINGTLFDSGYDAIANWATGERHSGMIRFDGTTVQMFVDDFTTPRSSNSSVPARANAAAMNIGTFTGAAGSWEHRICDVAIANRALSSAEALQLARAGRMHELRVVFAGDSNIADFRRDFYAPAGEGGLMWQLKRHVLPRAGWATEIGPNRGQSGQKLNSASAIAPDSLIDDAAALDAAVDANYSNILVLNIGTNDAHEPTYGGNMASFLADLSSYCDARLATGKYRGIVTMKLPASRNATIDARIDTINAGFDSLVTAGKLLATVPRASDDPFDGLYHLPETFDTNARHWTPWANRINAESLLTILRDVIPFHD